MRNIIQQICSAPYLWAFANIILSPILERTRNIAGEVTEKFFSELKNEKIDLKTFNGELNFFESPFSIRQFSTWRHL